VKDHPDDDVPRLVLADWLEEHGSNEAERARADFIRLQCRLARLTADDPARRELEVQEQKLRREYARVWVGDWQLWVAWVTKRNKDAEAWWFDRGQLGLGLNELQCLLDVPWDHPKWAWVSGLEFFGLGPQGEERLAACPALGKINKLFLQPENRGSGMATALCGGMANGDFT
jgi:uncharacterized protein (TIGR02996 family)